MTTITYTVIGKEALIADMSGDAGLSTMIRFDPPCDGYFRIGEQTIPVRGGVAEVRLSATEDGRYLPLLLTDEGQIHCAPLVKADGELVPDMPSEGETFALILRLCRTEERLRDAEQSIRRVTDAVFDTTII